MALLIKNHRANFSTALFFVSTVLGIIYSQPILFAIPFFGLIAPFVFNYCINQTANLFWILLLLLPFSTELNITSSLGIDFPDELFLMLLTALSIVKLIHEPKLFPNILKQQPLFFIVILIMLWTGISTLYSVQPILSIKFLLARTWYIIPFVVLPQLLIKSQADCKKVALLFVIPMLVLVIQALLRFGFYGFAFDSIKKTMAPFFRNHVNYSAMLVCLLPVAVSLFYLTPKTNLQKKWILLGIAIGLVGLFFAYSRGAWLALVVGILFVYILQKKLLNWMIVSMIILLVTATTWLAIDYHYMRFAPDHDHTIFHTNFSEHIAATVAFKDVSNAERFHRWIAGARMFADRPLTGFGANTFYSSYQPFTVSRFKTWVSNNPEHSTVHNYFLLTLLEQGIPGLLLFGGLYIGMLFKAQRLYHQFQNEFYQTIAICIGVILSMIGVLIFMSDLIETDKIGSLFWLCLGLLFVLESKLSEEKYAIA
jgi:O-antigen ligase